MSPIFYVKQGDFANQLAIFGVGWFFDAKGQNVNLA
jgi:hypothetical protein